MKLISVNIGTARPVFMEGRRILSAIGKHPIAGPVAVHTLGVAGDEQADAGIGLCGHFTYLSFGRRRGWMRAPGSAT